MLLNNINRKAISLLRKKKLQENLLAKTDAQLENIEQMVQDIEFAQIEAKVLLGLKSGNEALNKMHKLMSLENVEKIMDDTREAVEYQQQIDDLLAGGLTSQDEEDVEAELEDILNQAEKNIELPNVPIDKLTEKRAEKKERELVAAS